MPVGEVIDGPGSMHTTGRGGHASEIVPPTDDNDFSPAASLRGPPGHNHFSKLRGEARGPRAKFERRDDSTGRLRGGSRST